MIINTNTQIDWAPMIEGTLSEYYNSRITTLASSAFYRCFNLQTVSFPNCSYVGSYAFGYCVNLQSVSFPYCGYIANYAFCGCSNLHIISLPYCSYIGAYAFSRCYNLISLYLMNPFIASLGNSYAFSSTPIAGYSTSAGRYGSIYVPSSLFSSYRTALFWSYFSSRFVSV